MKYKYKNLTIYKWNKNFVKIQNLNKFIDIKIEKDKLGDEYFIYNNYKLYLKDLKN